MSKNKPISIEDLSDVFLTQCLRRAGSISKSSVTGHDIVTMPEPGQVADMAFIALSYDEAEADAPDRLVAKTTSSDPSAFEFATESGLYKCEVGFFNNVGKAAGVPIPACYYAEYDGSSGNFLLLMEDLTGNIKGDYVQTDMEMVESLVVCSAKMHSRWWQQESLNDFPWINKNQEYRHLSKKCLSRIDTCLENAGERLSPYCIRIVEAIRSNPPALEDITRGPCTLIHGDLHINNAFFTSDKQPVFIDWQSAGFGNPGLDFMKPFYTAKTSDQQRVPEILRRYLDTLHIGGVADYSFEQLERDALAGLLRIWVVEIMVLADTDIEIFDAFCESRDSSVEEMYGRIGELGERFRLTEFIEAF